LTTTDTSSTSTDALDSDARRKLRDQLLAAIALLVYGLAEDLASGSITLSDWEDAMRDQIKNTLGVMYVFGRGGFDAMTPNDWTVLSGLVTAAFMYLDHFAADIAQSLLSEDAIAARSAMYVGSGVGAYERGQAAALDLYLPVYPGDDCEGMSNCRCWWDVNDLGDGSMEAIWHCEDDKESCDVCIAHVEEYNPLFIAVAPVRSHVND
jgi:hypothetical protein